MLASAWATVPHSTDNTMSRGHFLQIPMTRAQSMTPLATRATHRRAGHLPALGGGLAHGNVHRLDVVITQYRSLVDTPFEGLVLVADEFQIDADADLAHDGGFFPEGWWEECG